MEHTLTITTKLRNGVDTPDFRKWEIVKFSGNGKESIIIRVKNVGVGWVMSVQYTLYPYKRFKKRWRQGIWMKVLRIKVWIGDLYK